MHPMAKFVAQPILVEGFVARKALYVVRGVLAAGTTIAVVGTDVA